MGLFTSEMHLPPLVFMGWHLQLAPVLTDSQGHCHNLSVIPLWKHEDVFQHLSDNVKH